MSTNDSVGLRLAAEEFSEAEFRTFHSFSISDEQVIRRLIAHGPVLLRGPRGSGKSAYMREAHDRISRGEASAFSAYVSLRHFPLLQASTADYMTVLLPYVASEIKKQLQTLPCKSPASLDAVDSVATLKASLTEISSMLDRRIVLMFDDVAHIGRETSLAGFFDFFRTIASSTVSCKATIYPGVTKFGSRFDLYSDATVIDAQRDERAADFSIFFEKVMDLRYDGLKKKVSGSELLGSLPQFLGRAVLGNVRAFNALCAELDRHEAVTIHIVGDSLKWLASTYLYPALEELHSKLGAYAPVLAVAEELAQKLFDECGRKRVNTTIVHREHVQRLGKVFEILEYSGFIAKREASRSLARSGSGRGPRYALSLGPLFEKVPGVTLSNELFESWIKPSVANEEIVEFPPDSLLREFQCPEPQDEVELDVLNLSIEKLAMSHAMPYGLTSLMISVLKNANFTKIGDVAPLSEERLRELPDIGPAKAQRIRNTIEQAVWM